MNAQTSGCIRCLSVSSVLGPHHVFYSAPLPVIINEQAPLKSGERTKVWTRAHEVLVNARMSRERTSALSVWDGLDIGTFRLGRSVQT